MATRYKVPKNDTSFSKWQLEHTSVLNKLNTLLNQISDVKTYMELPCKNIPLHGNTLFGTPDAVVEFPDGGLLIADAKSGKKIKVIRSNGIYGAMLKLLLGQKINLFLIFGFALCYGDAESSNSDNQDKQFLLITGENALDEVLPEPTKERIRNILKVSGAAEIPDANPSSNNCRFCDWKIGCPNAIETSNEVTTDASHFL